jgi:hypothetical protein
MANVLLRMPDELLRQINTVRAETAEAAGWPIGRNAFLLRLLTRGLNSFDQERAPRTQDAPMPPTAPTAPETAVPQEGSLGQEPSLTVEALVAAIAPGVEYDEARHYLGQLCSRGHDYEGTGKSLRRKRSHQCVPCDRELASARRQAKRKG